MKYIKGYKIFESFNDAEIKNNCIDILSYLSDDNISSSISTAKFGNLPALVIYFYNTNNIEDGESFDMIISSDLMSDIERLIDYLKEENFFIKQVFVKYSDYDFIDFDFSKISYDYFKSLILNKPMKEFNFIFSYK